ncbi:hypothetical protein SEUCBS140593_002000 [Sporothrix eucalyptigena]|uniref:Uncharacterized protein n=1 Tax=Sporothrix eucalyptigena TaxID=1812306 RepID=A0ABP0B302_9PEZI
MAKIGRNWRYVLNLAVRVHSTDPFGLPARIYDFSDVHLGGKYATAHNKVPNTGYGMVCDYERTLARSETMHPDQKTQSETELEECKELIEQASLSGSTSCSPTMTRPSPETQTSKHHGQSHQDIRQGGN